jgi:hypothetical protein
MRFLTTVALVSMLLYGHAEGKEPVTIKWLQKQGWVRDSFVDSKGKLSRVYTRVTADGKRQWLTCPLPPSCLSENTDECIMLNRCKISSSEFKAKAEDTDTKVIDVSPNEEHLLLSKYSTLDNQEELDRLRAGVISTCEVDDIFSILQPDKIRVQVDTIINAVIILDESGKTYSCMLTEDERCQVAVSEKRGFRGCVLPKWCVRYIREGEKRDCK